MITVISIEKIHYDYLKAAGMIEFSKEQKAEIQKRTEDHIREKGLDNDDITRDKFNKRFAVLGFFEKQKLIHAKTVFHVEQKESPAIAG